MVLASLSIPASFTVSQRSSELAVKAGICDVRYPVTSSACEVTSLTDIRVMVPQRVQHDINRCTVWKVRHIFNRNNTGCNPLFPWRPAILSPDLPFLCDVIRTNMFDTRLRFISVCTGKDLNIANDPSPWGTKRCIPLHEIYLQRWRRHCERSFSRFGTLPLGYRLLCLCINTDSLFHPSHEASLTFGISRVNFFRS